jgi:hypothetical protein
MNCLPIETQKETDASVHISSSESTLDPRRVQQKLTAIGDSRQFPRGPVLRVELPDRRYEAVLDGNKIVTLVMLNLSAAMKLADKHGYFSASLEDHHQLIICAAEDDEEIVRSRYEVLSFLKALSFLKNLSRSVYFIPDNIWVYDQEKMEPWRQQGAIESYLERVEWYDEQIREHGLSVDLIPLAKGWLPWHFQLHIETFNRLGIRRYAFYGVQYVGGDAGNAICELVTDVHTSISVLNPEEVLLIGRHSPADLRRFRPEVVAAAGLRYWKDRCGLDATGYSSTDLATWFHEAKHVSRSNSGPTQPLDYTIDNMVLTVHAQNTPSS